MDFVDWSERNHLYLNTSKTNEMVRLHHTLVNIQGCDIEMLDSFKYLGVHF